MHRRHCSALACAMAVAALAGVTAGCGGSGGRSDVVSRRDLIDAVEAAGMDGDVADCVAGQLLDRFEQGDLGVIMEADGLEQATDRLGRRKVDEIEEVVSSCRAEAGRQPGTDATNVGPEGPTTTTIEADDNRLGGLREAPVPQGTATTIGSGWTVRVDGAQLDGNAAMAAANQFNQVPAAGKQYVLVSVTAAYDVAGSKSFLATDVFFKVVGPKGVAYESYECLAVPPTPLDTTTDVFAGGTVAGNLCFLVDSPDAAGGLVLYAETFDADFDVLTTYFALS